MASITLGTFRDYLKALNDWVNGLKEPKVQLSGSLANSLARRFIGGYRVAWTQSVAAMTTVTVADVHDTFSVDIEYIEFATNHDGYITFRLYFYDDVMNLHQLQVLDKTGVNFYSLTPIRVRANQSALFQLVVDEVGAYKMVNARQLPCGNGFKLDVANNGSNPYQAGVMLVYNRTASSVQ